jgi:hypothetical protein
MAIMQSYSDYPKFHSLLLGCEALFEGNCNAIAQEDTIVVEARKQRWKR